MLLTYFFKYTQYLIRIVEYKLIAEPDYCYSHSVESFGSEFVIPANICSKMNPAIDFHCQLQCFAIEVWYVAVNWHLRPKLVRPVTLFLA